VTKELKCATCVIILFMPAALVLALALALALLIGRRQMMKTFERDYLWEVSPQFALSRPITV
jgi:hypothetical protein